MRKQQKPSINQELHTPAMMTNLIVAYIEKDLEMYGNYSNAYLALFPGYINGPVWCMDLYIGDKVHLAILEEYTRTLAIYSGSLRPSVLFLDENTWKCEVQKDGEKVTQTYQLFENNLGENCLKVTFGNG